MSHVSSEKLAEAENLLDEVDSWSEEEIERLPKLYRKKASEYRRLNHSGDR